MSCGNLSTAPLQHRNHELSHDPHTWESHGWLFSSAALTKSAELSSADGIERAFTKSRLHVCRESDVVATVRAGDGQALFRRICRVKGSVATGDKDSGNSSGER